MDKKTVPEKTHSHDEKAALPTTSDPIAAVELTEADLKNVIGGFSSGGGAGSGKIKPLDP